MAPSGIPCGPPSTAVGRERTRYFARQLVGAEDLTQDQVYAREKSRRHNRMLHGWGIACGARVRQGDRPGQVIVEAGYVLGPYGDEIVLDADVVVDVGAEDLDGNVASGCAPTDPWCADVRVDRPAGRPVYLAVAYSECLSRPVRVASDGCGCDETACEYSRVVDGYRLAILDELPGTYTDPMRPPSIEASVSCRPHGDESCTCPACAPCPTEPWVILADLTIDAGTVTKIDCDRHRRYVAAFGGFFYACAVQQDVALPASVIDRLKGSIVAKALADLVDVDGLAHPPVEQWHGDLIDVPDLEATPSLAKKLKSRTIAEIAGQGQDEFVGAMTKGLSAKNRALVEPKAREAWAKAADAVLAVRAVPAGPVTLPVTPP